MASRSVKTKEYDVITLQTIRATAPAYTTLTSDGLGGSLWSTLSSPFAYVSAFKSICTPSGLYIADASYNIMSFNAGKGIEFVPTGSFSTTLIVHAFNEIRVPGLSTLSSGQDTYAFSTLYFSSLGNTVFTTNPLTNKVTYEIRHPTFRIGNRLLPLNDQSTSITFAGQGDILLSTFTPGYFVGLQISTFNSTMYSGFFSNISTLSTATASTMSSIYTPMNLYSTLRTQRSLLTQSTVVADLRATTNSTFFLSTILQYSTVFSQYNSDISNAVSSLSSYLYFLMEQNTSTTIDTMFGRSTYEGIKNFIYLANDLSTITLNALSSPISTIVYQGIARQSTTQAIYSFLPSSQSTVLGTVIFTNSYVSSLYSTFSSNMTVQFSNLKLTDTCQDYVFFPPYTVFSGIQNANGFQYDTLLSTCSVNLSDIIPYINENSKVFLTYTPTYAFRRIVLTTPPVNTYRVTSYLTYDDITIGESIYNDTMSFNITNYPVIGEYQEIYNRSIRVQLNTDHLMLYNAYPYIIIHSHSNIINVNNPTVSVRQPNSQGGLVVPVNYRTDCDLNLYTTVQWSNGMAPQGAVSVYINNGVHSWN